MTKKKNIASKLVLVLFVLTLISCCLLGSTFARYVSGGSASASIGIAKWDVDFEDGNGNAAATTLSVANISPDDEKYQNGTTRTHSTTPALAALIKNNSEVHADVTVTLDDITFKAVNGNAITGGAGIQEEGNMPSYGEMKNTVMLQIYVSESEVTNFGSVTWEYVSSEEVNVEKSAELEKGESLYVYYRVEWKSADSLGGATADYLDTWIGQNVESISATLSYTAVQGSELPTT